MLPLTERLKRPNLFTRAYGAKKLVSTPIFTLYVLPRQEKAAKVGSIPKPVLPMVGFVVSKKVSKSACRRNKMKRRLREAYRKLSVAANLSVVARFTEPSKSVEPSKPAEPGSEVRQSLHKWYAMVFVIKENAFTATWSEIYSTLEKAFLEAARRYG